CCRPTLRVFTENRGGQCEIGNLSSHDEGCFPPPLCICHYRRARKPAAGSASAGDSPQHISPDREIRRIRGPARQPAGIVRRLLRRIQGRYSPMSSVMEISEILDRINRVTGRFEREAVEAAIVRQDEITPELLPMLEKLLPDMENATTMNANTDGLGGIPARKKW